MISNLPSDEFHHFKIGVLAEKQLNITLPEQDTTEEAGEINYIRHMNAFYARLKNERRLKAHHISLYLSLFMAWNKHRFRDIFPVFREQVMATSGIGSTKTYTHALKWLHECGYIIYRPSGKVYVPCQISIISYTGSRSGGSKYATDGSKYATDTGSKNATGTDSKYATDIGSKYATDAGPKNGTVSVANLLHNFNNKQINRGNECKQAPPSPQLIIHEKEIPTMEAATHWFAQKGQTAQEARKFFYHYDAVNWRLGSLPIANWKSLASKWIESIRITRNEKPGKLHVDKNKLYSEPL